ncbi:DUF2970 domain-containing protein [Marinobacter zhanjiangensis]|uniref:DUF2970 domain-containing protein n=1 Tax=Marinobacter zhanjiangensis TaxID=578215 RepID=A0ABQ3B8A1_9GAMM|nr:DUF2970 domain-containing protein [Marinobacter zhanjiangensis]GGY82125.1 hypothetical protein GCM10007071_31870 [Marinobacter zhanjiangensis]
MAENNRQDRSAPDNTRRKKGPGVLKVLQSVLAGAFGVQSSKRHQEDFSSHSPWPYIIAGIIFTVGFVVALALIVSWVLAGQ